MSSETTIVSVETLATTLQTDLFETSIAPEGSPLSTTLLVEGTCQSTELSIDDFATFVVSTSAPSLTELSTNEFFTTLGADIGPQGPPGVGTGVWNVPLVGAINGSNLVFSSAPYKFVLSSIRVLFNGVRVFHPDDFVATESTAGTGYDIITFASDLIPKPGDRLTVDGVPN